MCRKQSCIACGTVRLGRGDFPKAFKIGKLATGETHFIKNGSAVAVHWHDKRDVFAMSTMHGNAMNEITRRNEEKVMKPEIITEYNKFMNGVVKCDQYLNYYAIGRKSIKWWKEVFFHMFEMCVMNAMVLYFIANPEFAKKHQSHKKFRVMLVHEIVEPENK